MRISDWSSDVCSSDLRLLPDPDLALGLPRQPALRRDRPAPRRQGAREAGELRRDLPAHRRPAAGQARAGTPGLSRSEEHTSELQSLIRISYAVFCLKKKKSQTT